MTSCSDKNRTVGEACLAESRRHRGVSLVEVMVVMTVMAVLLTYTAPSFSRSVEQSHADVAAANLRSVWNAQRLYWLEHRTYTADLSELVHLDLVDSTLLTGTGRYSFAITHADDETFEAMATRNESSVWSGQLRLDETGAISGGISGDGIELFPGFL